MIASAISFGDTEGLLKRVTTARWVARFTETSATPGIFLIDRSTRPTQAAQDIPPIWNSMRWLGEFVMDCPWESSLQYGTIGVEGLVKISQQTPRKFKGGLECFVAVASSL
jgi:hypothetical protein